MTDNSKTPPARKTIQDPPEYWAATGEAIWRNGTDAQEAVDKLKGHEDQATYQQNGQSAVTPSEANMRYNPRYSEAAGSSKPKDERDGREGTGNVNGDWLGGPQNGAEFSGRGRPPESASQDLRGQLKWNEQRTGGSGDWLGGPQNGAEAPSSKESGPTGSGKAQGEGARNPQTGERIARNPQTGE
ncbi:hypothetical protein HJB93_08665 [Rhizobium sp. NLR12b]|uniref:hypothetical protein n=1 Tax=Rhizobium sp. NLR12b TaxID=2731108 RepID=UPI001C84015A|nr:hypothetical protein [Rhizobium sp. NLR12b]MBX5299313.1 hypothetical protein [Rhizobium sp. NLR12b]